MWLLVADHIWDKIVLLNSIENVDLIGEKFSDIARMRGIDAYDLVFDLLLEEGAAMYQLLWTSNSFSQADLQLSLIHI